MNTFAVDFESYYDKTCSIKTLGPVGYFSHLDFDAYMVSVVGDEGTSFVGSPKDFDWTLLNGNRVLSHNASFDESLYLFGFTKGWWARCEPAEWHCTADLCAYVGLPRNLKGASASQFGLEISKDTRDSMNGKRWENMTPEFKEEVLEYALKDSVLCLRLWQELEHKWPLAERRISAVNRLSLQRGVPIDTDYLKVCLEEIRGQLFEAENNIPWLGDKPILSRKAFNEECRKVGIEPPHSLALDNEEANTWLRVNSLKYPWVEATRIWRRINMLKTKLESFDFATNSSGRFYGGIMYFGAHTGRFSGASANLNLQNLPKDEMFGVNLRHLIKAPVGKKLLTVDLSQIEVRTLCWLANDERMLKLIAESDDIYEAFAIQFGRWSKEQGSLRDNNPTLRHMVKTMVLGCGYGAGPVKFATIAEIDLEEAERCVALYRTSMDNVVKLWRHYDMVLHSTWRDAASLRLKLPSGRVLDYGPVQASKREPFGLQYYVMLQKYSGKAPSNLYGGRLSENMAQALARDIFADMLVRVHEAGHNILFHVHDEIVLEVDEDIAESALADIIRIMSTPPEWIPDIPLSAEGKILDKYKK